jgi:dihydrofolate reductase
VARLDHQLDWLTKQATDGEDHGYEAFVAGVDGIVMGRGSYENVLSFGEWPYQKPVIVMSQTLSQDDLPAELRDRVRLGCLSPADLMKSVHLEGWARAYIDGGKLVQSFINEGLIEDLVVTTVPILIGSGRRLFGDLGGDIDLELLASRSFKSGLVQSRYRIVGDSSTLATDRRL